MNPSHPATQNRVRQYFRVKARQLAAIADLPVCDHPSLIGSHREELQRVYLREILPKRFQVGRGMVYGPGHRSKEADIVIWDSQNYPCLPMLDHAFFFAESARVVLESKSNWCDADLRDVLEKCRSVRDIIATTGLSLMDEIVLLKEEMAASRVGRESDGWLKIPHHIGTAAIFLRGGHTVECALLAAEVIEDIDDSWPDVMLLLEPGRLIIKNYEATQSTPFGGAGWLESYDLGEDSLIAFTITLLSFLEERSVQTEYPLNLMLYVPDLLEVDPTSTVDFRLTRPVPQRRHIWRSTDQDGPEQSSA